MRYRFDLIGFILLALVLPLLIRNPYSQHILVMSGIFILFSLGLNIIVGFLGQLSLGHSAYFGIGAYAYAILLLKSSLPGFLSLSIAAIIAGIFGFLIGYPCLRLKGPYFAIVSLAFAMIIRMIVVNWQALTNGPMGITRIKSLKIPFIESFNIYLNTTISSYYFVLCFVVIGLFVLHRLRYSRVGDAFDACRENEELAQSIGINTSRTKIVALIISTIFIGVSGTLYAQYVTYISPEIFG